MNAPTYRLRRATSDDLPELLRLWTTAQLPAAELEKRFTEFQVAEEQNGGLVAAIALQVLGKHGAIHSETIPDFAQADVLRPLLWERLKGVAQNHGLVRLWTGETARFWREQDFGQGDPSTLKLRPPGFHPDAILTLKLKDDISLDSLVNDEFVQLRQLQAQEREKTLQRARAFKMIGYLCTMVIAAILVVCFIFFLRFRQQSGR